MGYTMTKDAFDALLSGLMGKYRIWAPVLKEGEGRFTDTDIIRYDFLTDPKDLELERKSDYAWKEFLTPLSETLFYFTEEETKAADLDPRPVLIFLRSCDLHALKRLDQIYLENGKEKDWFYQRKRDLVKFALIGCTRSFPNCFCASMGTNEAKEGWEFSVDVGEDGTCRSALGPEADEEFVRAFEAADAKKAEVTPAHVTENEVKVTVPEEIPLSILKDPLWDEYNTRCIGCGRCNYACPTCTCFTMQDIYYTDNGRVGERRRVGASCMVDGYTNVAGGGQYRKTKGERMRFKVLHKIRDHRLRFGNDMCVGCGRCDDICPEYISFSKIINKVNAAVKDQASGKGAEA